MTDAASTPMRQPTAAAARSSGAMRRRLLTALVLAALALLPAPDGALRAQAETDDAVTPLLALPDTAGVVLRWAWPEAGFPSGGYHVERRAADGDWVRLTRRPITRVRDRGEARALLGEAYERYEALLFPSDPAAAASEADNRRALLLLGADVEPRLAVALGIRFDDREARTGGRYRYRLLALSRPGGAVTSAGGGPGERAGGPAERVVARTGLVLAGRYEPPPAPDELRAVQVAEGVALRWSLTVPFSAYRVYRDGRRVNEGPVVALRGSDGAGAGSSPHQFLDREAAPGDTLRYTVEGLDAFGRSSRRSAPVTIVVRDLTPPRPPGAVRTAVQGDTVSVRWLPSPDTDVAGYRVWRAAEREGPFRPAADTERAESPPAATSDGEEWLAWRDPGRPAGRLHWYRVTALDSAGNESSPSFVALAEVPDLEPPPVPVGLEGTAAEGRATLRWQPSDAPDLRGYRVYRTGAPDREPALLTPAPISRAAFTDSIPVGADHPYRYRVTAVDSAYNESGRSEVLVLRPPDVRPPRRPMIRSVHAGEERLIVEWLPNPDPDVAAYRVAHRARGEEPWSPLPRVPVGTHADTVRDVPPRVPIEVTVTAIDDAGHRSPPSETVTGEAYRRTPPPAPELRRAAVAEHSDEGPAVQLEWDAPSPDIARVIVLRREAGASVLRVVGTAGAGETAFVDDGVRAGVAYEYALRVLDRFGNRAESRETRGVTIPEAR